MEQYWKHLCACLEDELERQQNVLAVCQAQREAVRLRDLEYLEAKTEALETLIQEATAAERERLRTLRVLTEMLQLPRERQTLSELVRLAPKGWARRLGDLQAALKVLLPQIRGLLDEIQGRLRLGQRNIEKTIHVLLPHEDTESAGYASSPQRAAQSSAPLLIDSRG